VPVYASVRKEQLAAEHGGSAGSAASAG